MNILVTGACGFIGSHLVEKLVKENHNVRAFTFYNSRNSHGWLDNVDKKILKIGRVRLAMFRKIFI